MRLLVVEDEPKLAEFIHRGLVEETFTVDVVRNGEDALDRAARTAYDLVVLDLMLPGMDGYRVLRSLRAEGIDTPVLILTARGEESDKVMGFRHGADDYVTKPFGVLELLARVEALLRRARRDAPANGRVAERFGEITIERASRLVLREGETVSLAPLEYDLLLALFDRRGAVATRHDLLREVWGHQAAVVSRTVDTHILELRKKLERDPARPRHILTVRKTGYRLQA